MPTQSDFSDPKLKGSVKSKSRTPADIVRLTWELLAYVDADHKPGGRESKREEKGLSRTGRSNLSGLRNLDASMNHLNGTIPEELTRLPIESLNLYENDLEGSFTQMGELYKNLRDMKCILYGNSETEPVPEACAQLTQEFFRENTLRLVINCLPKLNLEARKDATQIVANLQRQPVNSRLIASDYLEANLDLLDTLVAGYEDTDMALHYGAMLRECIRHQSVARYVLESQNMKKFFEYIQLPNFDIAADVGATFKELMTRHKSTVAEFLTKNYDWFFSEYNNKLLLSCNYITRRQAIKLLGDILLERSNSAVMVRYVSSKDNLMILMNLLRESSKSIQIEAFHVFKLFVANQKKTSEIVSILVANQNKLLRLLSDLKYDKEDNQFEVDKAQVVREISDLEYKDPL